MFDLINSVMQTKPMLLEGIRDQTIEPIVLTNPIPEWSQLDVELGRDDTRPVNYSPHKSISPQQIAQSLQQGFRNDFLVLSEDVSKSIFISFFSVALDIRKIQK